MKRHFAASHDWGRPQRRKIEKLHYERGTTGVAHCGAVLSPTPVPSRSKRPLCGVCVKAVS